MNNNIEWNSLRDDFPYLKETVYLNAAGMSPLPGPVYQAGIYVLNKMHFNAKQFAEETLFASIEAHQAVADFYRADINDIAFTHNTSLGMNILALHLIRREPRRRHIVTLEDEFPSSTLPWAAQGFDLTYVRAPTRQPVDIGAIVDAITPQTQAVVASYVQFSSGARIALKELANELSDRGIHFILNATQAAGVIPIDLQAVPISAMLVSGNKWIMAGVGAGVMYINKNLRDEHFPPLAGWLSTDPISFSDNKLKNLSRNAPGLELGLNSFVPIACLSAATKYIQSIGVAHIEERISELTGLLISGLEERGANLLTPSAPENRAGIVTVLRDDAAHWVEKLKQRNIIAVLRGHNAVRISPHFYNNETDLITLLENW